MPSPRGPHNQKITVYLTEEELLALEEFRVQLLRDGVRTDRGKLVRAMVDVGLQRDEDVYRLLRGDDERAIGK